LPAAARTGLADGDSEIIVSGIADAVAYDREGRVETIVDWKSDVELNAQTLRTDRSAASSTLIKDKRARVVIMTAGRIMAA
jgi:hypothetical protein